MLAHSFQQLEDQLILMPVQQFLLRLIHKIMNQLLKDEAMKMEHMEKDIAFITSFTEIMANAKRLPVEREMPDNMKDKLDIYLLRKRDDKKK